MSKALNFRGLSDEQSELFKARCEQAGLTLVQGMDAVIYGLGSGLVDLAELKYRQAKGVDFGLYFDRERRGDLQRHLTAVSARTGYIVYLMGDDDNRHKGGRAVVEFQVYKDESYKDDAYISVATDDFLFRVNKPDIDIGKPFYTLDDAVSACWSNKTEYVSSLDAVDPRAKHIAKAMERDANEVKDYSELITPVSNDQQRFK